MVGVGWWGKAGVMLATWSAKARSGEVFFVEGREWGGGLGCRLLKAGSGEGV